MAHQQGAPIEAGGTRPTTGALAPYMQKMPPVIHEQISWTHICEGVTFGQRVLSRLDMVVSFGILLGVLALAREWVLLFLNPIVAVGLISSKISGNQNILWIGLVVWAVIFFWKARHNYGHVFEVVGDEAVADPNRSDTLEAGAINEEVWCREGAETWTWRQRIGSLWRFAIVHNTPWWYGIGFFLVILFVAGAIFMWVYLRTFRKTRSRHCALQDAAKVHYHHNRMASRPLTLLMICTMVLSGIAILLTG